jgi:hypothetical protein
MLKLGAETGNVVNHLYSRMVIGQPDPVIGMGATLLHWSDRTPATITNVFTVGKSVIIETREDNYQRIDSNGMSEEQDYEFTPNENGSIRFFRRDADGSWSAVKRNTTTGRWNKHGGAGVLIGVRERYYDYSF